MFYINQLCTPSFPIGLVKTESGFIVGLVETGLGGEGRGGGGGRKMVVVVISVDAYPFLAFSEVTYHFEDTEISVFCLHCAT